MESNSNKPLTYLADTLYVKLREPQILLLKTALKVAMRACEVPDSLVKIACPGVYKATSSQAAAFEDLLHLLDRVMNPVDRDEEEGTDEF